jgi:DNA adenine methylase/adenine-specific DNA-methyltransferase
MAPPATHKGPIVKEQLALFRGASIRERLALFPQIRFMGSKYRLLPWIQGVLGELQFSSALDAFSGSGAVGYLLKAMGKEVVANDRLAFATTISRAIIANGDQWVTSDDFALLTQANKKQQHFIERTFSGIFYTPSDLRFLDRVWSNLALLDSEARRALALAALIRSCAKRQPRGVFTVAGDPEHYKDGRRDLRLSLEEHFIEQIDAYNAAVFDEGRRTSARHGDVFTIEDSHFDLVYLDPPYVPRSDDNCYIKRYHFLEGLATYWEGQEILADSRVRKIRKPYTPFSYRHSARQAFDDLFARFSDSILVLSYSSNGFPDLDELVQLMNRYKRRVDVHEHVHRYHFGTHDRAARNQVTEYLVVGR